MSLDDEAREVELYIRNRERINRWRWRWFRARGEWPDELGRRMQVELGLPLPLGGGWPDVRELVRAARARRGLEVAA